MIHHQLFTRAISANHIQLTIAKTITTKKKVCVGPAITDSLKKFDPVVDVSRDILVVEDEQFSQEDIQQIAEEYIFNENSNKNIFKQGSKYSSWENIPKPVRWLILNFLTCIFIIYTSAIWNEATNGTALEPEKVAKRLVHFRKQSVRQVEKNYRSDSYSFVNTEFLRVHTAPRRKSHVVAVLFYPCEVKILKFKKKKRWALIEWTEVANEVRRGWVLGRYIYRKNIK